MFTFMRKLLYADGIGILPLFPTSNAPIRSGKSAKWQCGSLVREPKQRIAMAR
jgi:hypothetical protein